MSGGTARDRRAPLSDEGHMLHKRSGADKIISPRAGCRGACRKGSAWPGCALLLVLVAALSGGAGCDGAQPPARPPIILISLDTFRRDGLGAVRNGSSLTPHLDDFATDAAVFHHAFVQIPFTLPSHMSMLTGLYPDVHGVYEPNSRLGEGVLTLAQILHANGYATVGLVTNDWLKGEFGFARGFDVYERLPHALTYSDRVNARALEEARRLAAENKSFFLFLHYMDPHSDFYRQGHNKLPYYSPPRFRENIPMDDDGSEFCTAAGSCATEFLLAAQRESRALAPEAIAKISQLYDSGIRYLDEDLGRLFDGLKGTGLYDQALIILTSDHGEEFREHGKLIHSQTYDETIAVPLLFKFPGGAYRGRTVDVLVESVDLLPTLLDYLDLPVPSYAQGRSYLSAVKDGGGKQAVFSQDKLGKGRYTLRTLDRKLIFDFESGAAELYDLKRDPQERHNLSSEHPGEVDRLLSELKSRIRQNQSLARRLTAGSSDEEILTPEERRNLQALGYVD